MSARIIVCDDDKDILEVCKTILELRGHTVNAIPNCDHIFEIIAEFKPDLILMDLWLPTESGDSATKRIKANPLYKDIPVIIFSANNNIEKLTEACRADGYLKKPFDISSLEELIEGVKAVKA